MADLRRGEEASVFGMCGNALDRGGYGRRPCTPPHQVKIRLALSRSHPLAEVWLLEGPLKFGEDVRRDDEDEPALKPGRSISLGAPLPTKPEASTLVSSMARVGETIVRAPAAVRLG